MSTADLAYGLGRQGTLRRWPSSSDARSAGGSDRRPASILPPAPGLSLGLNGRSPVGHQQTVAFDGPPRWAQGRCARIRRGQKRDSLRSRQHNAETRLAKNLLVGLVTMVLATSAFAGERYTEVWNPPEARRSAAKPPKPSAHKPKKSRVGAPATSRVRRVAAVSTLRPATTARPGRPTFHDFPRLMTPEGNVLRVAGAQSRIDVEH